METVYIHSIDSLYPKSLQKFIKANIPESITAIGNIQLLKNKKLAVFCSVKCPGNIILQTYDCMKVLREAGVTVISGSHSPVEKECLNILLRGTQPVIVCPARSIENMRIKPEHKKPLKEGRLLFLSPFPAKDSRISTERAEVRNQFVASIADVILMAYAQPKSKTERLFYELQEAQKPVLVLKSEANRSLINAGAKAITDTDIIGMIKK